MISELLGIDPYTQAISNVYQDLVGEGSYHGKGIYDVEAFHSILSQHFPEEHLLSHDLIEGAFVGVGIRKQHLLIRYDPKDYLIWAKRQHRWIRGDWQIIDWLKKQVPTSEMEKKNKTHFIGLIAGKFSIIYVVRYAGGLLVILISCLDSISTCRNMDCLGINSSFYSLNFLVY